MPFGDYGPRHPWELKLKDDVDLSTYNFSYEPLNLTASIIGSIVDAAFQRSLPPTPVVFRGTFDPDIVCQCCGRRKE